MNLFQDEKRHDARADSRDPWRVHTVERSRSRRNQNIFQILFGSDLALCSEGGGNSRRTNFALGKLIDAQYVPYSPTVMGMICGDFCWGQGIRAYRVGVASEIRNLMRQTVTMFNILQRNLEYHTRVRSKIKRIRVVPVVVYPHSYSHSRSCSFRNHNSSPEVCSGSYRHLSCIA